jgi:hypothetical protein
MLNRRNSEANTDTETVVNHSNDMEKSELTSRAPFRFGFSCWKLPSWINFSLSPGQHSKAFGSVGVAQPQLSPASPTANVRRVAAHAFVSSPTALTDTLSIYQSTHQHTCPVAPHPAPDPWDDQTVVDRPYNNPFYSRPVDNVLWLPRNPCGMLDLDDTIDLRTPLGIQISELVSPTESPRETKTASLFQRLSEGPLPNGSEEIELPAVIIKRIRSREGDVQQTSNRSIIHHQKEPIHISTSPRQFSAGPPNLNSRSLSDDINIRRPRAPRRASSQFAPRVFRARSIDVEQGAWRSAGYNTSEDIPQRQNIPAHQAIVHEVLAEEDLIRQLEEKIHEGDTKVTKSWLTSWMFTKAE